MSSTKELMFENEVTQGVSYHTNRIENIYHNLKSIDPDYYEVIIKTFSENESVSAFLKAGRFIIVVTLEFDRLKQEMVAMDLKNGYHEALNMADVYPDSKNRFMNVFTSLQETYDSEYFFFEVAKLAE